MCGHLESLIGRRRNRQTTYYLFPFLSRGIMYTAYTQPPLYVAVCCFELYSQAYWVFILYLLDDDVVVRITAVVVQVRLNALLDACCVAAALLLPLFSPSPLSLCCCSSALLLPMTDCYFLHTHTTRYEKSA